MSEVRVYDAPSDLAGRWVRETDMIALRAENATLRQLLEDVLHTFGYLRFHRVAGMDGLLYETHNKMSPERTVEACEKRIRAILAAQDAGKEDVSHD